MIHYYLEYGKKNYFVPDIQTSRQKTNIVVCSQNLNLPQFPKFNTRQQFR